MAIRLRRSILRGEIDNRIRGRVTGRIWLAGDEAPFEIELSGNARSDLAGCRLSFTNPRPVTAGDGPVALSPRQHGHAGELTASRKVRVSPEPPGPESPAVSMANALYLEWFSAENGRVVIESTDCTIKISAPAWRLTAEEEAAQMETTHEAMRDWLDRLRPVQENEPPDSEPNDPRLFDEFAYEKQMRESDARTDKYMELLEKYEDHPDREMIVAREMGWEWMEDASEAQEWGALPPSEKMEVPPLEPDPAREGIDWVRNKHGDIRHPLSERATECAHAIWHFCDGCDLLGEESDSDLREMIFQFQTGCAKIAGALNSLAYDSDVAFRGGFVVAALKRALGYLNRSLAAAEQVAAKNLLPPERLAAFRAELFSIREEMLRLMQHFRGESSDEDFA